jgi:transposase
VAIADDIGRFPSAHQFEAFLGLVPGERSSGEKRRLGHITKAGNRRARYLRAIHSVAVGSKLRYGARTLAR